MRRERSWNRRAVECTAKPFLYAGVALALVGMAFCPKPASALSISGNDWKVTLSGEINGFYEYSSCQNTAIGGLALAGNGLGCGGRGDASSIGNGLLPNILSAEFTTTQAGWDLSAKTSLMTSIATTSNVSANNSLDVRQAYFTVGRSNVGTFKIGRDYGIFASNAILNDMTLLGIGVPAQATIRAGGTDGVSGRVALGHIGVGYAYLGSYGQITYTSPTFSGFTFSGGVFSPVDNFVGTYQSRGQPQFQAQLAWTGDMMKLWVGAKSQHFYKTAGVGPDDFHEFAGEVGGKVTLGPLGVLLNAEAGKGLGILQDGDEGDTMGVAFLAQATYQATQKLKLGASAGLSRNTSDPGGGVYGNFKSNSNLTVGGYYALTKNLTLDLELSRTLSKDYNNTVVHMNGIGVGGIVFF